MSKIKKIIASFTVASTVLMMGAGAVLPVSAVTIADGDLVKTADSPAVYLIQGAKKRVFPHLNVYLSWGYPSDFSTVKTVSASDLALYADDNPVPFRDGSMFRGTTKSIGGKDASAVFYVENGQLRPIKSADIYQALFNDPNWTRVTWVPDDLLSKFSYPMGSEIDSSTKVPDGSLVKYEGSDQIYLIQDGKKRAISSAALEGNRYNTANVITVPSTMTYEDGTPITGAESSLVTPGWTSTAVASAVSVSFNGPASKTLVTSESLADLADFVVSGTGTITAVALKRIGVSEDATLSNVYLFDGDTRLTDAASVSSGSNINFTGLDIAVSGSKTISVRADIAAGTSGQTVGVELESLTLSSGSVSGLPLAGNLHTIASATLASASLGTPTAAGNSDPGTGIKVWENTLTVSTRDVTLTRLALRQLGSINSSDIENFRLSVDGTEIASVQNLDANGYVTFGNLSQTLKTGTRTLKVTADVIGGSGRTVEMSLRGAYDISLTDSQYNANLAVSGTLPSTPAPFSVNSGTMTVVKATDSQAENVTVGATDQSLATYTFTAYGEKIKVETLHVGMIPTTTGSADTVTIQNVRILVNGSQVGSTTNVPAAASYAAASGTSFTTNFYVEPGTPVTVEIRGDLVDSEGTDEIANGTVSAIQAVLVGGPGTANAIRQVSLGTYDVPTQDNVAGNTLNIRSGSISLSKTSNYGDQTMVAPQTAYKIASFNLIGNSVEDVNINTFEVDFTGTGDFDVSDLSDVYIKYGDSQTSVKGTVAEPDNTWSPSFTLAKNETMPIEVYATIASTAGNTGGTMQVALTVTGVTADSSQTVYADSNSSNSVKDAGFAGQVITASTGSFTVSVDASRPNAALVDDYGTVTTAAFKFDAVNDSYTITDVTLTIPDASAVQNIYLMDGSTTLASKPAATSVTISGLSVPVSANTSKVLTVQLEMGTIGAGAGTTGSAITTTLSSATARNSSGTSAAVSGGAQTGQAMYAYKAIPTITNVSLPSTTLTAGGSTQTIAKFTISTNGTGTIAWDKLVFTVNKNITTNGSIPSATLYDVTSASTQVAGTATVSGVTSTTATSGSISFVPDEEQQISGSKTYELRAVINGTPSSGDSVTTRIDQPSAHAASATAATVEATSASFVWSDVSATSHATSTSDWTNDYLVKNLPTDSQNLTK